MLALEGIIIRFVPREHVIGDREDGMPQRHGRAFAPPAGS